jgi:hypothetical protein
LFAYVAMFFGTLPWRSVREAVKDSNSPRLLSRAPTPISAGSPHWTISATG